jgi:mannosyltransferase OCH1-like enzyme
MKHDSSSEKNPGIIWIMWRQGFANAPKLVQKCLESWRRHNPGWQIVLLDEQSVRRYLNLNEIIGKNQEKITVQAISNIVRINLLANFGGVWVDATCFCCQPLDE